MSDNSWVLKGVDPETRQKAEAEAERLGMSLADYLTDTVLRAALSEQVAAMAGEDAAAEPETDSPFAPPPGSDAFAVRHRIKSLERRLGAAVGGLDGAIAALDSALVEIASRVGDVEAVSVDTAGALNQALHDIGGNLAAVRLHISDVEVNTAALSEANDAAHADLAGQCESLGIRIDEVQDIAIAAERTVSILGDAHENLKHAVAHDFAELAQETAVRLGAGMDELRAAANEAADQADAAAAHLVAELRGLRDSIEQRLADNAAESRARMHAAFGEAAERLAALTERVIENERFNARMADSLRGQITDVEDGAQTALEETAESLRQAGAALAHEVQRTARDAKAAIEGVHEDLSAEIGELNERSANTIARVKQLDASIGAASLEISAVRGQAAQSQADWDLRFDALAARLGSAEASASLVRTEFHAETNRVEECTLAALETLAARIAATDETYADLRAETTRAEEAGLAAAQQLALNIRDGNAALTQHLNDGLSALRGENTAIRAQLADMNKALARAADGAELAVLQQQIGAIATKVEAPHADQAARAQLNEVMARLTAAETQSGETSEQVQGVARMLGRVSAQAADVAQKAEDRLHKLEIDMADFALTQRLAGSGPEVDALQQRVEDFERRQVQAFESLSAEIARFITENHRRLATLEAAEAEAAPEPAHDLAAEFDDLRRRIEERIVGVEMRSVRTLEQVVDTVALLEKRFSTPEQAVRQTA